MKKVLLIAVFSTVCLTASFAQIRVGGFLANGSEIEQWGLGANAEFFLNEKMAIQPNLIFYFPEKANGVKSSVWELNADFHYYFFSQDVVSLYGKGGLNFTTAHYKIDVSGFPSASDSQTELGLNLGIGANFNVGSVLPFVEVKYVLGDFDEAVIALGVKFPLKD